MRPPELPGPCLFWQSGGLCGPLGRSALSRSLRQQNSDRCRHLLNVGVGVAYCTSHCVPILAPSARLAGLTAFCSAAIMILLGVAIRSLDHLAIETMEPYTLLIIARSQSLAKRLRDVVDAGQYTVRWAPSSTQALSLELSPSLLVLDMPPSGGARSVAKLKRRFDAPLLVLQRSNQPIPEQVDASQSRISRTDELVEAIETTLINHSPYVINVGDMSLDTESRRLQMNGTLHQLPPISSRILAVLMKRPGQIIPRDELFRRVWQTNDGDSTRALDVHIASLRRRLEANPRHPELILTERGVGYRLQRPA